MLFRCPRSDHFPVLGSSRTRTPKGSRVSCFKSSFSEGAVESNVVTVDAPATGISTICTAPLIFKATTTV
jgi:hypothetical protein